MNDLKSTPSCLSKFVPVEKRVKKIIIGRGFKFGKRFGGRFVPLTRDRPSPVLIRCEEGTKMHFWVISRPSTRV